MDQTLNYAHQVSHINKLTFMTLKCLYRLRDFLPRDAKLKLCDALVLSKLNYGDTIYKVFLIKRQKFLIRYQNI